SGASWSPDRPAPAPAPRRTGPEDDRAVGAKAANLRWAALREKEAATLAEMEGLVTHLTSLVLVDEKGAKQTGLPMTRKVGLPTPRTSVQLLARAVSMSAPSCLYARTRPAARMVASTRADMAFRGEEAAWEAAASAGQEHGKKTHKANQAPEFSERDELSLAGPRARP